MDASSHGSRIRFGKFEVDFRSGELRKHGQRIRIQPQPMKVLVILLERPGELVTRDELRKRLWPGELYVDFEHGLNRSINKLRRALLDEANSPLYVETLSTRGYRFIASVEVEPEPGSRGDTPFLDLPRAPTTTRSAWKLWLALAIVSTVLFATLFAGRWHPAQTSARASATTHLLKPIPLVTFTNGSQWHPAFSPDGSRIAYSRQASDGWYLEVKDFSADTHLRLTQHSSAFPPGPAWSPDGRQIAYARAGPSDDRGIFIISSIGGPERRLRSIAVWRVPQRLVSWSPDGHWIAFADELPTDPDGTPSGRRPNAIFLISPETLEARQLTHPAPGDFGDAAPTFSPDGATIAFVRTRADSHDEVYTIPLQGGTPHLLVTAGMWTNGLAWTDDGKSIVFDRSMAGGFKLWRVTISGRNPYPLEIPSDEQNLLEPTLWHDRLAYEVHQKIETIARIALDGLHSGPPATPLASTRVERAGRYSPDGQRIAFISDRTGSDELWTAEADGANPVQLTQLKTPLFDLAWHPDDRSIAVSAVSGKVFLVNIETHQSHLVFAGSPFSDENVPNIGFSRDGNSLYVLSQPGTGKSYDLLKVSVSGGIPARVVVGRLTNFQESPDGKSLYYSRDNGVWRLPVKGGTERFVAKTSGLWDLHADGLYALSDSFTIERFGLDGRHLKSIARLKKFEVEFPMSLSPDGRSVLLGYRPRQTVEIDMVPSFN